MKLLLVGILGGWIAVNILMTTALGVAMAVSWQTLIMPSGGSYTLGGSMIAADMSGYGGIPGRAHHHSGSLLRSGFFTSAVAALGAIASGNTSQQQIPIPLASWRDREP